MDRNGNGMRRGRYVVSSLAPWHIFAGHGGRCHDGVGERCAGRIAAWRGRGESQAQRKTRVCIVYGGREGECMRMMIYEEGARQHGWKRESRRRKEGHGRGSWVVEKLGVEKLPPFNAGGV